MVYVYVSLSSFIFMDFRGIFFFYSSYKTNQVSHGMRSPYDKAPMLGGSKGTSMSHLSCLVYLDKDKEDSLNEF